MHRTNQNTPQTKPSRKPLSLSAAVLAAGLMVFAVTSQATPIRESRIVGLSTGNLGTVGAAEGWTGSSGNYSVASGSGSLAGTNLGLFASAGDKVDIASSGTLGQLNTYNNFAAAGDIPNALPNKVYYSFLYRFNDLANMTGTTSNKMFQANRFNSSSGIHFFMYCKTNASGKFLLGVQKGNDGTPVDAATQIDTNQTFFVVLRQQIIAGTANDIIDLWINPTNTSFGVDEFSIPSPDASATVGTEDASTGSGVARFYVIAPGASANMDELRIATNSWADVTPAVGSCTPATIDSNPTNVTVSEGISASFAAFSSSSSPLYQWQRSTNAGVSWQNVPDGIGDASANYTTPPLSTSADQNRYRCIVNVTCGGGSSATSTVATVTVNAATPAPLGLVVDDNFADLSRTNAPITTNNSVWFASTGSSLSDASSGSLIGTPASGSSRVWIGYFTENATQPVHLAVGRALKTTLEFSATGIVVTNGGNSMRFGLFDYADGGTRVPADGFSTSGTGVNVRGYMFVQEFGTSFVADTPQSLYVRNQLDNANLMGSTGAYISMGSGPDGATLAGTPAFTDGIPYKLELTAARMSNTETRFTSTMIGGGTTNTTVYSDTTYAYPRYDAIAIRPNSAETTAASFTITRFRAEVINAPAVAPTPEPLLVSASGGSVTLTWTNAAFKLQAAPEVTGTYTNVTGAVSPHVVPASGSKTFYRLVWP